ncbi:nicotinamide riboside transporter PnuC [Weeksellaceae bacterium KMM 9713]|uniref:Nicotinamide riboside transporter PnuC n=1 Tax=Profundicola chukchiensis TaxID=2961959 RepID=A0A9X4MWE6_9FLAO|nr:nicotinamide riboside transporter PnuC [Profundicola chukchiensis]MDG4945229.1 nicotinamide riboside transporter PnuC [Profundicola chukchiensis]
MQEIIDFFLQPYAEATTLDIILEITAALFGVLSVLFAKRGNILVFPTGIISTGIYIYITYVVGYIGDFTINIYYTAMSVYGWILWSNIAQEDQLKISWSETKDWLWTIGIFLFTMAFVIGVYIYFDKFEDWTNYFDVLTTGLAFGSMWLMAKKKVENWLGWIITNIISAPLYFAKGLGFTGIQFIIFLILAVQGYQLWKKAVGKSKVA